MKIHKIAKRETAAIVVLNSEGKALVLKRGDDAEWEPNKWNLPGGGIEEGETPKEAAIRECQEEAGLTPKNVEHLKDSDGVVFFIGESDEEAKINFESSDFRWITKKDVKGLDFVPSVAIVLPKAFSRGDLSNSEVNHEIQNRRQDNL